MLPGRSRAPRAHGCLATRGSGSLPRPTARTRGRRRSGLRSGRGSRAEPAVEVLDERFDD
jgi:hypothetical protein